MTGPVICKDNFNCAEDGDDQMVLLYTMCVYNHSLNVMPASAYSLFLLFSDVHRIENI